MGGATSGVYPATAGGGQVQDYRDGRVYLSAGGARGMRGEIGAHYQQLAADRRQPAGESVLGLPVSNESPAGAAGGAFNDFAADVSIYWSPATGARAIGGAIRGAWRAAGGEAGSLGFPTSDEFGVVSSRGGTGRGELLSGGAIYHVPDGGPSQAGTFVVTPPYLAAWGADGWENGALGLPTSGVTPTLTGTQQTFQGGVLRETLGVVTRG